MTEVLCPSADQEKYDEPIRRRACFTSKRKKHAFLFYFTLLSHFAAHFIDQQRMSF